MKDLFKTALDRNAKGVWVQDNHAHKLNDEMHSYINKQCFRNHSSISHHGDLDLGLFGLKMNTKFLFLKGNHVHKFCTILLLTPVILSNPIFLLLTKVTIRIFTSKPTVSCLSLVLSLQLSTGNPIFHHGNLCLLISNQYQHT